MQRAKILLPQDWTITLLLIPALVGIGLFLWTPIEHKISPVQWMGFFLMLTGYLGLLGYRNEKDRIQISAALSNKCNLDIKGGLQTKKVEGYYELYYAIVFLIVTVVQIRTDVRLKWHFLMLTLLFMFQGISAYLLKRNEAVVRLQLMEDQIRFFHGGWTEIPYQEITEIKETKTAIKITSLYHSNLRIRLGDFQLEEMDEFKEKLGYLLAFWNPGLTSQHASPNFFQPGPNP